MDPKIAVVRPKVALKRWMRALLLTISALGLSLDMALAEDARDVLSASLSGFAGQPIAIDSVTPSLHPASPRCRSPTGH